MQYVHWASGKKMQSLRDIFSGEMGRRKKKPLSSASHALKGRVGGHMEDPSEV